MVNNLSANTGDTRDTGLIPGLGISPGEENDHPLQYSCLENSMDRGAWRATVYDVAKSQDTTEHARMTPIHRTQTFLKIGIQTNFPNSSNHEASNFS